MTRRLLCLAAVLVLGVTACGGDDGDDTEDAAEVPVTDPGGLVPDTAADDPVILDACTLLEESEVEPYVGATGPGSGGGGTCSWENPDSLESVTVTVGEPRTAIDGLPEPSPYDDAEAVEGVGADARYSASPGIVEFVAGDRACELQVATVSLDEGTRRDAAIELAALALGRIPD